jgi:hypothetical protein
MTPEERLKNFIEYEIQLETENKDELAHQDPTSKPVLLIEHDGDRVWFSLHDSPAGAAQYSVEQEYAHAWQPDKLVFLWDGDTYTPEVVTTVNWHLEIQT